MTEQPKPKNAAPCPFCGCSNLRFVDAGSDAVIVQCKTCGAEGPEEQQHERATAAVVRWNRREKPKTVEPTVPRPDYPFNDLLKFVRESRGLEVKEVAELTGFTPGFVRSYEDCFKNPTVSTLFKLCRALGLHFVVDPDGVSAIDLKTNAVLLDRWDPPGSEVPK